VGCAEAGHLEVLKYLRSEGLSFNKRNSYDAAYEGHLEVLKYVKSEGVPFDSKTCEYAAYGGHIEVLKYLRSQGCPWNADQCLESAELHHYDHMIEWIHFVKTSSTFARDYAYDPTVSKFLTALL